jgi:hypothetical protein
MSDMAAPPIAIGVCGARLREMPIRAFLGRRIDLRFLVI